MNPILLITRSDILERQAFSLNAFPDNQILAAIEAYDIEGSVKHRARSFIAELAPLWRMYNKGSYEIFFRKFIDMEIGLEAFCREHSSHVNHVIQEFLLGYNILMNCGYVKKEYNFEKNRDQPNSRFGGLFFSWMAASLLHDIGYDIERAPEEEVFREEKNTFWDFMTPRATTISPLTFSITGLGREIIEKYILEDVKKIPGAPSFSYTEFENLFLSSVPNRVKWKRYDHGVISAVKYYTELQKLQNNNGGNYLNWPPNRHATLAMALHNFRYKDCDLKLSSIHASTFIPYLLIISDEIQEWERERLDIDAELPEEIVNGRNAKKAIELVGINFKEKYAFVILDHKLKDPSLKEKYEIYLDEKIALQKKHYPIRVFFPQLSKKLRMEILKKTISASINIAASVSLSHIIPTREIISSFFPEIIPSKFSQITASTIRLKRLRKIAETKSLKNFLIPNSIYEIYVDHRIDGEPYLTVVFPF